MMETAKRLYLLLPLLAVDTRQMLSSGSYDFSDCEVDIAVTSSSLQLEELLLISVIQTQTRLQRSHEPSQSCSRLSVLLRLFVSQTGRCFQLFCHKAVIQSADVVMTVHTMRLMTRF